MHSVIVAAYNCLIMLLIAKPALLRDKQTLQTVTNCIEIGISGSSSYTAENSKESSGGVSIVGGAVDNTVSNSSSSISSSAVNASSSSSSSSSSSVVGGSSSAASTTAAFAMNASSSLASSLASSSAAAAAATASTASASTTLLKADKELRPASLRVKEAAECVLCFLMEHTSQPPPPPALLSNSKAFVFDEAIRTPLDERALLELTGRHNGDKFRYYAIDGSLLMGILERPLVKAGPVSAVCPTVTVLLRGPFGQQAWSLHLRPSPYSKLGQTKEISFSEKVSTPHLY